MAEGGTIFEAVQTDCIEEEMHKADTCVSDTGFDTEVNCHSEADLSNANDSFGEPKCLFCDESQQLICNEDAEKNVSTDIFDDPLLISKEDLKIETKYECKIESSISCNSEGPSSHEVAGNITPPASTSQQCSDEIDGSESSRRTLALLAVGSHSTATHKCVVLIERLNSKVIERICHPPPSHRQMKSTESYGNITPPASTSQQCSDEIDGSESSRRTLALLAVGSHSTATHKCVVLIKRLNSKVIERICHPPPSHRQMKSTGSYGNITPLGSTMQQCSDDIGGPESYRRALALLALGARSTATHNCVVRIERLNTKDIERICHPAPSHRQMKSTESLEVIRESEENNRSRSQEKVQLPCGKKAFACSHCSYSSHWRSNLRDHLRKHAGERRDTYSCNECGITVCRKYSIRVHFRIHSGDRPYKCNECSASFTQWSGLKTHKRVHTREKPFVCHVCPSAFSNMHGLNRHKLIHTGEKLHVCDICSFSCYLPYTLRNHRMIHTGERPYVCEVCSSSFSTLGTLKVHKRTHTGEKPFVCDICSSCFLTKSNLTVHKRTHTGEKPYCCDICPSAFTQWSSLQGHKRIHTGERPFVCGVCTASFAHKSILNTHKRIHTGAKQHVCDVCPSSFSRLCYLKVHIRRAHTRHQEFFRCNLCGNCFSFKKDLERHINLHMRRK